MAKRIILLSGPVAAGKTTLGTALADNYGFQIVKTKSLIRSLADPKSDRQAFQGAGDRLDRRTKGRWLVEALARKVSELPEDSSVLVDAVRIEAQVNSVREVFGPRVVHVHLTAPAPVLQQRYARRAGSGLKEFRSHSELRVNRTERDVDTLSAIADIVIDTQRNTDTDVLVRVATRLGLYGRGVERLVDVLVGGQYGSEGKGHVASYIAPEYDVLVRVGGPNAGHKVYELPEPYTFHQLPSGTRCSEARLVLGPGAVIRVPQLQKEIADCAVSKERLSIDPQAMIIDDADITFENELKTTIGSTGQGVGAATARKILRTKATPLVRLAKDVAALNPFVRETLQVLEKAFSDGRKVLLEGTQGTGLSLHHGPYPYVTSRDTSGSGCLAEAGIGPSRVRKTLMVIRSYPIRVQSPKGGTSGPMGGGKELSWQEISRRSGIPLAELLKTERTSTTDRRRRVAEFDWFMLRRAVSLNSPTDIAMTFADYISVENRKAIRFEQLTEETLRFVEEIERVATAPVSLIATRFESRSIIDRRSW